MNRMHALMKLGRRTPVHDKRTLQLAKYIAGPSQAPGSLDYASFKGAPIAFNMAMNDRIGDCTIASIANLVHAWTTIGKHRPATISDAAILTAYRKVSGYDPAEPDTDRGAVELDVLRYWKKHGVGGHKLGAYASVEIGSPALVRDALWLFAGLYAGVALPRSAQDQSVWEVPPGGPVGDGAKGSWGGHAVPIVGYDPRGLTVVTWGATKRVSWGFFNAYFDESYACLSPDFLDPASGLAPSGFDVAQLRRDLALL